MSKQIKPNASAHRKVNPMVNVVAETLRGLGYAQLKAVKPGHAICFNEETGELVLIDQLNSDTTGNYNGLEIWKGLERIGILNKDQLYAIINGEHAKQGYPDWRMFDKGYYQAISKIRLDWEGFIKTLQDNKDDESSAKALAAKYAIPEADAKKLLELSLAKMTLLGDKYVEERLK
jgi:hypothetical protein